MSEKQVVVRVIQPTKQKTPSDIAEKTAKRRVAAYARVSTDEDEQLSSYENQVNYYSRYISSNPDWEFVRVYSDEGISGLNTKNRNGFKQMLEDAMNGKIDLILTKSISRFARNTVDTLTTIRQLKEKSVEVYFEKENIYTFDGKGELLLTIMSSLAQEESRSISENVTWGKRRNMARGKVSMSYKTFLGYEKGPDGRPQIVEKEAEVVRRIYKLYLEGCSVREIARILKGDGILTPAGKNCNWSVSTINSILRNEKYKGDALLQKFYTVDFLSKKVEKNADVLPQYYVEKSHPAIIDEETFDMVQEEFARRRGENRGRKTNSVFSRKVVCGDCGNIYGPVLWHSDAKGRTYVWRCSHKYDTNPNCATPNIREESLQSAFTQALNRLLGAKESYIAELRAEMEIVKPARTLRIRQYLEVLEAQTELITGFSDRAFTALADKITVCRNGDLLVRFKDGTEVTIPTNK